MFLKKLPAAIVLGMGLGAFASSAFAATNADFTVTGTISPTACDITLSKANLELGRISTSQLAAEKTTELAKQNVDVTVICQSAAKFALSAVDNATGSAYDSADTSFGLGKTPDNENIGYFNMRFDETRLMGDTQPVIGLASTDKTNWTPALTTPGEGSATAGPSVAHGSNYLAFGDSGTSTVKNLALFDGTLEVRSFIAPTNELTLSTDVSFAGSTTIELNYL
jgi:type 1 fimbria pilin